MIPNVVRGGDFPGLMRYLVGPGRANEHTHPMVVAADARVVFGFEPGRELSGEDAQGLGRLLDQPRRLHGTRVSVPVTVWDEQAQQKVKTGDRAAHVWHCSLSLRSDDRAVDARQWGQIAQRFVEQMGFTGDDPGTSSRWVAIHHGQSKHGNDHIHVAVQLVREDGEKANTHRDFARAQKVCRELEKEFGLARVETARQERTLAGYKGAEQERAKRAGESLAVPVQLRQKMRAALSTAGSPLEYLQALEQAGVKVAPSFHRGGTGSVRGYKVALDGEGYRTGNGEFVFAAPSKLDASLSWPNVCTRFGRKGREEAEQYLAGLHGTRRRTAPTTGGAGATLGGGVHPVNVERLMSGKRGTGPDTLANIYARLAGEFEEGRDGPFGRLAERMAHGVLSSTAGAYRVRQAAPGYGRGAPDWVSLARQANRLSRLLAAGQMGVDRPRLAQDVGALVAAAERVHRLTAPAVPARGQQLPEHLRVARGLTSPAAGRGPEGYGR